MDVELLGVVLPRHIGRDSIVGVQRGSMDVPVGLAIAFGTLVSTFLAFAFALVASFVVGAPSPSTFALSF